MRTATAKAPFRRTLVVTAIVALGVTAIPAAIAAAPSAPRAPGTVDASQAGTIDRIDAICDGLGQVTVSFDPAHPNDGRATIDDSAGVVSLQTPLPIRATDRRTGQAVGIGAVAPGAVACTPMPLQLPAADAIAPGQPLPPGVLSDDLLDGTLTIAVNVLVDPAPPATSDATPPPTFPYEPAITKFLGTRTDVGSVALYDRQSGTTYAYAPTKLFYTASIVKADILAALMHRGPLTQHQKQLATIMIERSDNDAATELWWDLGGGPGVAAFNRLIPMPSTVMGSGGLWGLTQTNGPDQLALLRTLSYPNALLSTPDRNYELNLMRHVIDSQNWGVSAGVPSGASVALKNGFATWQGFWNINSIGYVTGAGLDYDIAILSTHNSTESYGITTVEGVSKIVVPMVPRPDPSAASTSANSLDTVRRIDAGSVEYRHWTKHDWSDPESLQGVTIGGPALATTADGLAMFTRGSAASKLWWRRQSNGVWGGWAEVPGQGQTEGWAASSPAVTPTADGGLQLFVRGTGDTLWTATWHSDGSWSAWRDLGGVFTSGPAACTLPSGVIVVAVVSPVSEVDTATLDGSTWSGWKGRTGLVVDGDPGIACPASGAELFARGIDLSISTRTLSGPWTNLGGTMASGPAATVRGDRVELFARGTDGSIYRKTRDGSGTWGPWKAVR